MMSDGGSNLGGAEFLSGGGHMGAKMRAFDWSSHPLGPVETWPQSLRTAVSICLSSRFPMVLWWGPELYVIYNDAYRPSLGTAKHPALGKPGYAIWPEIWHIIGPMLESVMQTGEATWSDDELLAMERHNFLEETYWTFSYSPIRDENGQVCGVFTAVSENTLRVVGERRLRTLRELAAQASGTNSIRETCNSVADTLRANPADVPFALLYLVCDRQERLDLAGSTPSHAELPPALRSISIGHAEDYPGLPLEQVLNTGQPAIFSVLPDVLGGMARGPWPVPPGSAVALPLRSAAQDRVVGLLLMGVNPGRPLDDDHESFFTLAAAQVATALANASAYEEEKKRAEALSELDRAKTVFFSNVSHEFRTPLTLMLGPLEELLRQPPGRLSGETRDQLDMVHRNSLRLLKLVNTMLDFSRIEAGRIQAHFHPVDLGVYTAELASIFRSAMDRAGIRYLVNCPSLQEPVYVDPDLWEKIVLNLLSNALKFTLEGEIEVQLVRQGETVELWVRDTGVGISGDDLRQIFNRFHRARESQGRTHEGTGIGLALVEELVKLHGGTVEVESTPGRGSLFKLRIPCGCAHLQPAQIHREPLPVGAGTQAEAFLQEAYRWLPQRQDAPAAEHLGLLTEGTLPTQEAGEAARGEGRARVLVVDDNADMSEYLARLLGQHYVVETVGDGQAALERCRQSPPDLVLSDVMMPRLDGFGLLEALRRDEKLRELPFLLLSARAGEEARIEGMEAGADDYLVKPFTARELLARVASQLKIARVRRESEAALRASEARYRAIIESQSEMVCRFRPQGEILFANSAYARTCGRSPETMAGADFWQFVREEDKPQVRAHLEVLSTAHPEIRIENRIETAQGTRWTLWTNRALAFDEHGIPTELQSTGIDITDRKLAEAALKESEQRFKNMADAAPAMIWTTNERHQCVFLSKGWYQFTGQREEEGYGFGWTRAVHPEDQALASETFLAACQTGAPFACDYRLKHVSGGYRWVIDSGRACYSEEGEFKGYVGSVIDVHERKQAEEALQEAHDRLEERVRERTRELQVRAAQLSRLSSELTLTEQRERQRIAQLLHDHLQQLLVAAKLRMESMAHGGAEDQKKPWVELAELMDEALTASRSLTVELAPPILHEAGLGAGLRWLARRMQEKHQLEVKVQEEGLIPPLRDDLKILLFQSARELLFNVVKHSGATHASVEVSAEEGHLRLSVHDPGVGFDPQKVFRGDTERDSGFGLFSVLERLTLLGGRLEVESSPGSGTTLAMYAPLHGHADQEEHPETVSPVTARASVRSRKPAPGDGGRKIRVLLVDDHDIVRQGVRAFLGGQADLEVVGEAADGEQAIRQAHALLPDIILMDYSMPRMNGLEATRRIKQELPSILIIGLSMYEESDQAAAMKNAGASEYRSKSGDSRQLLETIRGVYRNSLASV